LVLPGVVPEPALGGAVAPAPAPAFALGGSDGGHGPMQNSTPSLLR
jgi:hypothetical protein